MKDKFLKEILDLCPNLHAQQLEALISDNLIFSEPLRLPRAILEKIELLISALHRVRCHPRYISSYEPHVQKLGLKKPKNFSMMMSLDLHLSAEGEPKIIEINTNAAFLILSLPLYRAHGVEQPRGFSEKTLFEMIFNELRLEGAETASPHIAIVDKSPEQQRLYVEFLVALELFRANGINAEIRDLPCALNDPKPHLIYNRWTDFYLTSDESVGLRKAWLDGSVILSPNPYEYLLLADKERLIDWSQPGFFKQFELSQPEQELLGSAVPKSYDLSRCDKNAIWDARKNLFFKPKREFGSKKAFKGASISRKTFEELCHKDCMAQEYIPAPIYQTKTANGLEEFKYDLRCYFYQDQLQSIVARVYQGQVTNLRTPGGGFAPVLFDTGSAGH